MTARPLDLEWDLFVPVARKGQTPRSLTPDARRRIDEARAMPHPMQHSGAAEDLAGIDAWLERYR